MADTDAAAALPSDGPFEFLNPLDNQTYTLPPFDPEKFADEVAAHGDYIPKVTFTDALLADDPQAGMDMLDEPQRRWNILAKRSIVKTFRNHLPAAEDGTEPPAWLALSALIEELKFDVIEKIAIDWRTHSGDLEVDPAGEG